MFNVVEGVECMGTFKLYNALLWLTNATLGTLIVLFFFKYLLHPADYTRDVRLDDGLDTTLIGCNRQLSDRTVKLKNPIVVEDSGPPVPHDENFAAVLKGTLPRQGGDGRGAAFLRSITMNAEFVAFVGEKILLETRELEEYSGWTLAKVWRDKALFNGPNGRTKELTLETGVLPIGSASRVSVPSSRSR